MYYIYICGKSGVYQGLTIRISGFLVEFPLNQFKDFMDVLRLTFQLSKFVGCQKLFEHLKS